MREYTLSIKDMMAGGLRPDDRVPRNSGFLETCQNVRVSQVGGVSDLSVFTPVTDPFAAGYLTAQSITIAHPFPQIFKGSGGTYLLTATKIYNVIEAANWTVSQITTYDGYDIGTAKSITGSGSWHMADFGTAYAFFNGTSIVFSTNRYNMFGESTSALVTNDITVNTGCAFRGRMIMGGFNSSNFWNDHWDAFLRELHDNGLGISFPTAPGSNYVWWSDIGEGGFFLLYPDAEFYGLLTNDEVDIFTEKRNKLYETIEKNLMGFRPMPWQGAVRCVKPLGNGVMVYGDEGISYMPSVQGTFGLQDVLAIGVAGRSAVGANSLLNPTENVFVDDNGWLYRMSEGKGLKRLGYREYFEDIVDTDIVISYDPVEREYHIANSTQCFVLTEEDKLYESTYLVTSTAMYSGNAVGVYQRPGNSDDAYAIIKSGPMDFGVAGIHTVEGIVVSMTSAATSSTTVTVAMQWKMNLKDTWYTTPYKPINYEGGVYFPVRGVEFKVLIRSTSYSAMDIDDIVVRFKTTDKRLIRGFSIDRRGNVNA